MLIEFTAENYKSFKDKLVFSMKPAPKQKGLDYSILKNNISSKEIKALSAAAIYGPNAAGKTTIISAMQTLKAIVQRGHINNCTVEQNNPNVAECLLELIPNMSYLEAHPVMLGITFIQEDLHFEYYIRFDLGKFLNKNHNRSIIEERLNMNFKTMFHRQNQNLLEVNSALLEKELLNGTLKDIHIAKDIAQNNLVETELFLSNGFKNIFSPKIFSVINDFFSHKFLPIYHADNLKIIPIFDNRVRIDQHLNEAVKQFGVHANLVYTKTEEDKPPVLFSSLPDSKFMLMADIFESYGTIRFANMFPLIADALQNGKTLVIDEFDASIHPMAIINIISIFHNDEINRNKAQLIFNTHNPLYLNSNILRRDEIKFVDRDDESYQSVHYSLSDFGTKGTNARKGKDYMDKYFVNEYGAIKTIDLSSVCERIVQDARHKKTE